MPFPGLAPNRAVSSAFPSPSVSRNARTPPVGDWSATNTSPLGATAMSRTLAGPPVGVLASYTTRAQKPPGRFRPPLSGSQIGRTAEPAAAIPDDAWTELVDPRLARPPATIAASRGTTVRTLALRCMRPPRGRDLSESRSHWPDVFSRKKCRPPRVRVQASRCCSACGAPTNSADLAGLRSRARRYSRDCPRAGTVRRTGIARRA